MKTLGLLGGMSWESTELYYRYINEETKRILGGLHSAPIAMVSLDFQEIEEMQHRDDWQAAGEVLVRAARQIEAAGADLLMICTNTMHLLAEEVEAAVGIPLFHVADATARRIRETGLETVGLLGTRFTMEKDFYRGRLQERHGLKVLIPPEADRDTVHRVIYEELCLGRVEEKSRRELRRITEALGARGAQGVILGCTEIGMLLRSGDTESQLFDTTRIHAEEAVKLALEG